MSQFLTSFVLLLAKQNKDSDDNADEDILVTLCDEVISSTEKYYGKSQLD